MATNTFELVRDNWTNVGTTPCFIQAINEGPVTFVIDTKPPETTDFVGHKIGAHIGDPSADIGLAGQNVFARALFGPTTVAVSR